MNAPGLGRHKPADYEHVNAYAAAAVIKPTVTVIEHEIQLISGYRPLYDQGQEGACTGFSGSWVMSLLNRRYYDAEWLYQQARLADPIDAPDGATVRGVGRVLKAQGHRHRTRAGVDDPPVLKDGIAAYRWAQPNRAGINEIRTAIGLGIPVQFGIDWYEADYAPQHVKAESWIGVGDRGELAGGHAICAYGVSDTRQAFRLVNSWGVGYPPVWISYDEIERRLVEGGEAMIVTDR